MDIDSSGAGPKADNGLSIANFYGATEEGAAFSAELFREGLARELARERSIEVEGPLPKSTGLRVPMVALGISLLLAAAAMSLSIHSARIEEEKLSLASPALYGTESLLIETLKQRSDLDISQRDSMIEEYQNRSKRRAAYVQALKQADEPIAAATAPAPATAPAEATLDRLNSDSRLEAFYSETLNSTLSQIADELQNSQTEAAAKTLETMQATLGKSPGAVGSKALQSALKITQALSASIDQVTSDARSSDPDEDAVIAALESARAEKLTLLAQVQSLAQEKDDLRKKLDETAEALQPEGVATEEALPVADFLGTVSIVEGDKILVDIAQSASPKVGASVVLFRPSGGGKGSILATATIRSLRASMAELELDARVATNLAPLALDAVYMRRE
jgi:hypothetical protein